MKTIPELEKHNSSGIPLHIAIICPTASRQLGKKKVLYNIQRYVGMGSLDSWLIDIIIKSKFFSCSGCSVLPICKIPIHSRNVQLWDGHTI